MEFDWKTLHNQILQLEWVPEAEAGRLYELRTSGRLSSASRLWKDECARSRSSTTSSRRATRARERSDRSWTDTDTQRERGDALTRDLLMNQPRLINTVLQHRYYASKRNVQWVALKQCVTLACFCTYCCVCITLLQVRIAVVHNSNIRWVSLTITLNTKPNPKPTR